MSKPEPEPLWWMYFRPGCPKTLANSARIPFENQEQMMHYYGLADLGPDVDFSEEEDINEEVSKDEEQPSKKDADFSLKKKKEVKIEFVEEQIQESRVEVNAAAQKKRRRTRRIDPLFPKPHILFDDGLRERPTRNVKPPERFAHNKCYLEYYAIKSHYETKSTKKKDNKEKGIGERTTSKPVEGTSKKRGTKTNEEEVSRDKRKTFQKEGIKKEMSVVDKPGSGVKTTDKGKGRKAG